MAAQHLAHADVDGHRAGAAVPAGAGRDPGALLPQRSLNEAKVEQYIAEHPTIGPWLDRLQAFEVFSSFWFTAIYALLFVSLVGCLTPRLIEHARSLRATPSRHPATSAGCPSTTAEAPAMPAAVAADVGAAARLAAHTRHDGDNTEISAEKGYLREFGNIVFHFSLLGLLVAVAVGKLFGYEGNVIVIADGGPGFCSASPAAFDSFRAGNTVDGTSLPDLPARQRLRRALPADRSGHVVRRQHRLPGRRRPDTNTWRPYRLQVNHPLRVGGDRVYLQGHGYAPTFTVTFPDGQTRTSDRAVATRRSAHAAVVRGDPRRPARRHLSRRRRAPQADRHPGPVRADRAAARHAAVVELPGAERPGRGHRHLPRRHRAGHRPAPVAVLARSAAHRPGPADQGGAGQPARRQQTRLDDGTVVRFDGAVPFINVQVSHDPAQVWVLVFALTMMAGLLVSLVVRRRRVWVRIAPAARVR